MLVGLVIWKASIAIKRLPSGMRKSKKVISAEVVQVHFSAPELRECASPQILPRLRGHTNHNFTRVLRHFTKMARSHEGKWRGAACERWRRRAMVYDDVWEVVV